MKDLKKFEIKADETKEVKGGPSGHPTDFYGDSLHSFTEDPSGFGDGN